VRCVDAHVEVVGSVARVRITVRDPDLAEGSVPVPDAPGHQVALVLPDPGELDFSESDPGLRDGYRAARQLVTGGTAQLRVVFVAAGDPYERLDEVFSDLDLAVGVVTGDGLCVLGARDDYAGWGTGRIFTLVVPESVPVRSWWLVPSVLKVLLLDSYRAASQDGGPVVAGVHELPDLPTVIDAEIDGEVYRLELLQVRAGHWPMRPVHAIDARTAKFAEAWEAYFPRLRCPIGWLQEEMQGRDPDPGRVPPPPIRMTGEQRLKFVEMWHMVWPEPAGLRAFADRPGWQRAVETAESLLVAGAGGWNGEVELVHRAARRRWCENAEPVVTLAAAALYKAARATGVAIEQVALCQAARLLAFDEVAALPEGLPFDSVLAMRLRRPHPDSVGSGELRLARLRALRLLSCPHPGAAQAGADCVSARERIGHGGAGFGWEVVVAERITDLTEDGVDEWVCEMCGAQRTWMLARPARAWWWLWVLCRCGDAAPAELRPGIEVAGISWSSFTPAEFERFAKSAGFGRLAPWTDPKPRPTPELAGDLDRLLPAMMDGGTPDWRDAVRTAARELAERADEPAVSRAGDHRIVGWEIERVLALAALTLYALAESGLPPRGFEVRRALAAGPERQFAMIAAAVTDTATKPGHRARSLEDEPRPGAWPRHGWRDPSAAPIDPIPAAWALLTREPGTHRLDHTVLGGVSYAEAGSFRHAYRLLSDLLGLGG